MQVVTSHELDVHGLPDASGVHGPTNGALRARVVNVTRARRVGIRVSTNKNRRREESGDGKRSEHFCITSESV